MRISDWSSDVCSSDLHAVAHRGNPARDLRGRPHFAREQLDLLGVAAIGLMRREHVVISGNDADIHRGAGADHRLILARSGKAVREVAARRSEEHTSELQSLMRTTYSVFRLTKQKIKPELL